MRSVPTHGCAESDHFRDERAAYRFVEARLWPNGAVCPHCGEGARSRPMFGATTRVGLYKCYGCGKPFTVKIGTIFEHSHVPLHLWLRALYLKCLGKRLICPYELHRILGVTPKTAAQMVRRIEGAMRTANFRSHFDFSLETQRAEWAGRAAGDAVNIPPA